MFTKPALRFLREPAVLERTGLGHTRLWELEQAGKFPRRVKISERACGWLEHEVEEYIAGRVALSRAPSKEPSCAVGSDDDAGHQQRRLRGDPWRDDVRRDHQQSARRGRRRSR